jgi:predicted metal-dependent phosphoesterase TrpH
MIDLHVHTDASDGRQTPEGLVERARAVGITTLGVTDHDTTAALPAVQALASAAGIRFVPGIEMTAVDGGRDVHVLGYWIDPESPELRATNATRLSGRVDRGREIAEKLAALGAPIDIEPLLARSRPGDKSLGRPHLARCLVEAGHVQSIQEAFDRYLGEGGPAYLPNSGPSPEEVVGIIARAGGIASLAHAGLLDRDDLIPRMAEAGLSALEVHHCAHDERARERYRALAQRYGLAVSGGSDYHGEGVRRAEFFGKVGLSAEEFAALEDRAARERRVRLSA